MEPIPSLDEIRPGLSVLRASSTQLDGSTDYADTVKDWITRWLTFRYGDSSETGRLTKEWLKEKGIQYGNDPL